MERVIDMSYEDQKLWEEEELDKEVNFEDCKIGRHPLFTLPMRICAIFRLMCDQLQSIGCYNSTFQGTELIIIIMFIM